MNKVIVVASPHKVGSTWLLSLLVQLGFEKRKAPEHLRQNIKLGLLDLSSPEVREFLGNEEGLNVFKSHSFPPSIDKLDKLKIVTMIRDPRDLLVSKVFQSAQLSPELGGRPELNELSDADKIKFFLNLKGQEIDLLIEWFNFAEKHLIRYEDLLANPLRELRLLLEGVGINKSDAEINKAIDNCDFQRMKSKADDNRRSFFRKGIKGDWVNYFDDETKELFKKANEGKWNKFLIDAGYEEHYNWS
jgi:hypothetical protein